MLTRAPWYTSPYVNRLPEGTWVWGVGSPIERFCLQARLTGRVADVSWCPVGPHRGPVPRGEQGGPGGAEVEGLSFCSRWTGQDAPASGSWTKLGEAAGSPGGALACWGCLQTQSSLRPRLQEHVGVRWVALFLRTEQMGEDIQAAQRRVLPGDLLPHPPARPKPKEDFELSAQYPWK